MLTDQAQALRDLVREQASTSTVPPPRARPVEPNVRARTKQVLAGGPLPQGRVLQRARTIAVASGKGGVGKTIVSVNLAIRLSQMGRRVILVDADLGTANADVMCNVTPVVGLAHVVAGRSTVKEALVNAPGGFRLVAGASGLAQMAALSDHERGRLLTNLQRLETDADVMIIDIGAGVSPNVLGFLACADQQLIVTTPEPPAVTDAYALIKALHRLDGPLDLHLLVNMTRSPQEARQVYDRMAAVCQRFLRRPIYDAGSIVDDAHVPMAVRQRIPFVLGWPKTAAAGDLLALAHRLDRHAQEPAAEPFLRRLTNWWRKRPTARP